MEIYFTNPLHRGEDMIKNEGGEMLQEVVFGKKTYLYRTDTENDYLDDKSGKGIKVNLIFTKNKNKNAEAKQGIKVFLLGISS